MPVRFVMTALVAAMVLLPSPALSQDLPLGDLQTRLLEGDRIRIVGVTGAVTNGRFDSLPAGSIRLNVKGKAVTIPNNEVSQVQVRRKEGDGVLIGLGIGAAAGFAFVQHECRDASEHRDCLNVGRLIIAVPMAIVGALFDLGFKRYDTVFRRTTPGHTVGLAPLIGARRKGVALTVSF